MHYCSLLIKKHYYLKLFLTIMFNIINFKTLCTVCETVYLIFQAVCITLKLLKNDEK